MRGRATKSVRWVLLTVALFACGRIRSAADPVPDAAVTDADAGSDADAVSDAGAPRLDAGGDLIELPVPGYLPAYVSVPNGSTSARPVIVAPHGVGDRPDWQCNQWRRMVGRVAWVLCPRGTVSERWTTPGDTRWTWHGPIYMKREIEAGLDALAARFGDAVDETSMVYGGFSYGAANGVAIVAKEAARFPYAVLIEGGADRWTSALAKDFVKNGGKRVLFVCGQASCVPEAERVAEMIGREGVEARVEYGKGQGHGYGGAVAVRLVEAWPWATANDPRLPLVQDH